MSIEEIIKCLDRVYRIYSASVMGLPDAEECENIGAIRAAIEKLKTRPDNQPNEALTFEELKEMDGQPIFVEQPGHESRWALVNCFWRSQGIVYLTCSNGAPLHPGHLGTGVRVYRRPPEEAQR